MIYLKTVMEAYDSLEINDVALIRSKFTIADALTEVKTNFILLDTMKIEEIDYRIPQRITRTEADEASDEKRATVWI